MSKVTQALVALRDLPNEELQQQLAKTQDDLFRLKLGQHTNQVTSTAGIASKRRDIARISTILRGRSLGIETQAPKAVAAAADVADTSTPKVSKKS
jgi:ribosomal protein L29